MTEDRTTVRLNRFERRLDASARKKKVQRDAGYAEVVEDERGAGHIELERLSQSVMASLGRGSRLNEL